MTRQLSFSPGEFYHLYNRGTEKRNIFQSTQDRQRFLTLLYLCNSLTPVNLKEQGSTLEKAVRINPTHPLLEIGAYCLMPNHIHLLVRATEENGISRFMQKLMTAYTMYFNKKYERSGALFQGKFKATHVMSDCYLKYLIAYIHLNPVKIIDPEWKENGIRDQEKAEAFLEQYRYSSFLDYWKNESRPEQKILIKTSLPEYFENGLDFKKEVAEWLTYGTE